MRGCDLQAGCFHHGDAMKGDDKTSVKNVLWQADVTGKEGIVQEAPRT